MIGGGQQHQSQAPLCQVSLFPLLDFEVFLTISVLVPHVHVAVLQTRALLGVLVALDLGDQGGLAGLLVA